MKTNRFGLTDAEVQKNRDFCFKNKIKKEPKKLPDYIKNWEPTAKQKAVIDVIAKHSGINEVGISRILGQRRTYTSKTLDRFLSQGIVEKKQYLFFLI